MKRFSFFVDFDDTITPTKHLVAQYLSSRYGVNLTRDDITNNNDFGLILKSSGVNVDRNQIYLDFGKNFFPSFALENFALYSGAKEAIEKLSEIYNIYIVTSRQESEKKYLRDILEFYNLFKCFEDIHCVWKWNGGQFIEDSKTSFMKRQKGTNIGFLDDSLEEIKNAVKETIGYPVLFDPFLIHKKEGLGYDVCSSWEKVEKTFS